MPYIKIEERPKFANLIQTTLLAITNGADSLYIKGEYFGYFVNRLIKKFQGDPNYSANTFNSAFFNEEKKKTLMNGADKISAMLNRSDPLGSAGELNYAISAIYWGFLGCSADVSTANYGMRAYLTAILQKVCDSLQSENNGSQRDAAMSFRRHLVIRGVLLNVLSETDRRQMAWYEDGKRVDNGDIWTQTGELVLPKE